MGQRVLSEDEIQAMDRAMWNVKLTKYSGRFMGGAYCPGFIVDDGFVQEIARFFVALARRDWVLAEDFALDLRTDDFGLGEVFYFPSVSFVGFERFVSDDVDDCVDEDEEVQ